MPRMHAFTPEQVRQASDELGDWLERNFTYVKDALADGAEAVSDAVVDGAEAASDAVVDGAELVVQGQLNILKADLELAKRVINSNAGKWVWGTLQGGFNEKATIGQVLMDAVISCIPVVGDITAARDLVALTLSWAKDPEKMKDPLQWVYCTVLCASLVPVAGGVLKGVGRLVHRFLVLKHMKKLSTAAKAMKLERLASDIIALLNRLGVGHAEAWLTKFRFTDYAESMARGFQKLVGRMRMALGELRRSVFDTYEIFLHPELENLVNPVVEKIKYFREILKKISKYPVAQFILKGAKKIDDTLKEVREFVINGFEKPQVRPMHEVRAGKPNVTYADEMRVLEGKGALQSTRGGYLANSSIDIPEDIYVRKEGFPDLKGYARPSGTVVEYPDIANFSGKIVNREIESGEKIYRVFGVDGVTHGQKVKRNYPGGDPDFPLSYWGVGEAPANAEAWRKQAAVLDEWNRDGFILEGRVLPGREEPLRACVGLAAEQFSKDISSQYLPGGVTQAMIEFSKDIKWELDAYFTKVIVSKKTQRFELDGIEWELRMTGWNDANGIYGYSLEPSPVTTLITSRLAADEFMPKWSEDE